MGVWVTKMAVKDRNPLTGVPEMKTVILTNKRGHTTEDNIRFPSLANHVVLSKFWKVDLDRNVV